MTLAELDAPEVATEEMQFAMAEAFSENGGAGQMWGAGVAEWRRGDGV